MRAAKEFALPQIEIVQPRLAVCLGKAAFNAVALAAGHPRAKSLTEAIASPFEIGRTQVWCQAHTGQQGTNFRNRNGVDRVTDDWTRMVSSYGFRRGLVRRNEHERGKISAVAPGIAGQQTEACDRSVRADEEVG